MDDSSSSTNTRVGETIAEIDGVQDVTIVNEDDGEYTVTLPDGSAVNTTGEGIDQLESIDWSDYPIDEDWTKKPWEPDPGPDPSPLDPSPSDPIGVVQHTRPRTTTEFRYECPNCGGKFKSWHKESGGIGEDDTYHCPFCMKERGDFGPEDDEERIRELVREAMEEANRNRHRLNGGV